MMNFYICTRISPVKTYKTSRAPGDALGAHPTPTPGNHRSDFCDDSLDVPVLEFHIIGIVRYIWLPICLLSLGMTYLRFIGVVARVEGS